MPPFPTVGQTIYGGWSQEGEGYGDLRSRFSSRNTRAEGTMDVTGVAGVTTALANLVNATMQPGGGQLDISGTLRIEANFTFPKNIRVRFMDDGMLSIDNTMVVTFNGDIMNDPRKQIFSGVGATGGVVFAKSSPVSVVRPQWFGGTWDDTADDAPFINAACVAASTLPSATPVRTVILPPFARMQATVQWSADHTAVEGCGEVTYSSVVNFMPTVAVGAEIICLQGVSRQPGVAPNDWSVARRITFISSNTTRKKVALDLVDMHAPTVEKIWSPNWTGGNTGPMGTGSELVRIAGRDLMKIRTISGYADVPLHFQRNAASPSLSMDHVHIEDVELKCLEALGACITIDDNLGLSNFTTDGYCALAGGKYGLYWNFTGGPTVNLVASIRGLRYENPLTTGGWAVYWTASTKSFSLRDFNLGGVAPGPTSNGLYIRSTRNILTEQGFYTGAGIALDIDGTCESWINNGWEPIGSVGATANIAGMTQVDGLSPPDLTSPFSAVGRWVNSTTITRGRFLLQGQKIDCGTVILAPGAFFNLPPNGFAFVRGKIEMECYDATGGNEGEGTFVITPLAVRKTDTGFQSAVGTGAGTLNLFRNTATDIRIHNGFATQITVNYFVRWS